ncbi:MAG: hypothetical protein ACTSRK_11360 [Promethearchaeota archaeon]
MSQINFRIDPGDMVVIKKLAEEKGISVAELAKRALKEKLKIERLNLAFQMLFDEKVGFKGAWKISGLEYKEFLSEWVKHDAHEKIPLDLIKKNISDAKNYDWTSLMK